MDTTYTLGKVFAGFTINRMLGAGGMGAVYLATHPRLPRENALKVLPPQLSTDPMFRARFEREAELAAELSHPHIVRIHDRGEYDGQLWLSMDYVEGTDAAALLRESFPDGMPLDRVVAIIRAVGSALDYAHHRGLLHRDVKPDNILLAEGHGQSPVVYLADFGVARRMHDEAGLTATNMAVGTVNYAAPEQLKGEPVDGRADQYALACTAFHLLTGKPPYVDSNSAVVIAQHVSAPPPSIGALRPALGDLDWVFAVAMAKEPSRRFASCQAFADQLAGDAAPSFAYAGQIPGGPVNQYEAAVGAATVAALNSPALAPTVQRRSPRRRPGVRAGVLACALCGIVMLVAAAFFGGIQLYSRQHQTAVAATDTAPVTAPSPPNTGPFTGVYQVEFGVVTGVDGQPAERAVTPTTELWGVRSVCGSSGCVATAARLGGETMQAATLVLDEVDGTWVAVSVGSSTCANVDGEVWETFALQPLPGGSFSGEATQTMTKGCANKRTVTFTRTGDADLNSLPDPGALPPRINSPAAALHGRYHQTSTQPNGFTEQRDYAVRTDCLRAGDRCMSLFHAAPAAAMVLIYRDGSWVYEREFDARCWKGGMTHVKIAVPFALPQPTQDPVTLLVGHGREELTGSSCPSTDVDVKFARTGD
ncbi:serine/threonine-protein kinase [Mycobacterium asiaticum]|uniref:serine/threonine-protein kinase n=1 Tax=Mycobacterium asiaticum TaxID=1790 RepID=UPI000ADF864D|nr:serine/threonine-protein kinase [Mycobacterium asiaticum]